jgi:hypothetical protein
MFLINERQLLPPGQFFFVPGAFLVGFDSRPVDLLLIANISQYRGLDYIANFGEVFFANL